MTLRSSDLQSEGDLDSIRNSCDVYEIIHDMWVWTIVNIYLKFQKTILEIINLGMFSENLLILVMMLLPS